MQRRFPHAAAVVLFVILTPGCSQPIRQSYGDTRGFIPSSSRASQQTPIRHIIIVIQENRSFDNIFSGFPGADAPASGYTHDGQQVALTQVSFLDPTDLNHSYKGAIQDYDGGNMDGFDLASPSTPLLPYSYVARSQVKPYWTMASRFVLDDDMFPTELGGSFASHLNLIAGTDQLNSNLAEADNPSNLPWGCDAPAGTTSTTVNAQRQIDIYGPFPCFDQFTTMADTLDASGVSWKYYAPQTIGCPKSCDGGGLIWSVFDSIQNVRYGADWTNIVNPQTTILQDAASGNLAALSWVVPAWADSDHPGSKSDTGPSWVAAIVNAIGHSSYWKSSVIVVVWDDWGGWYDDVPPPQLDFMGLAIRVPCIVISPYAKAGTVVHQQYEFGSILKFAEETFGLASLGHTDARAQSLSSSFDFGQAPIKFRTIKSKYPPTHFLREGPSQRLPDDDL